jgi:hypothetical protein
MDPNNNISIIASRVQSLEGRLDDNIDKINNRLDMLVDLMQRVTALQEREINNQVQITELKTSIKETNQSLKDWNAHLHERMDRHYTDLKVCREGIDATVKNIEEDFKEEVEKVEEKNAMTQNELAKWLNRGIGAWALASVLLIVLQAAGAYVVNGIVDAGVKTDERMTRMEVRMLENEKRYIDVMSLAKSQHPELMDLKVK